MSKREYRNGLVSEFKFWRQFEDAAASRDVKRAALATKIASDAGQHRHEQWADADGTGAGETCRIAIIQMKFFLLAISEAVGDFQADRKEYLEAAKDCEKAGGMAPLQSALR